MTTNLILATNLILNHVGFLPHGAKHVVIINPPEPEFAVSNDIWSPHIVFRGPLKRVNSELGDAWVGDFSAVQADGVYEILCGEMKSRAFSIHQGIYDQPLRTLFNYYPTQRCGDSQTGWNAPCHLGDATRADTGERVDLTGGWHQSCDLRKWITGTPYGLSGLSQLGLLKHPHWDNGQIADELRWGNRYFHHMIRPDGGLMDSVVVPLGWGERQVYPNDPPTCTSYMMIVGQTFAARYLKERDLEHSRACLDAALRIWAYMTGPTCPQAPYKPAVLPPGHEWLADCFSAHYPGSAMERGDALYAGIKLYEATGEKKFLDRACALAADLVKLQVGGDIETNPAAACFRIGPDNDNLIAFGFCTTFGTMFGAMGLAELALLRPDHPDAPKWKQAVRLMAEQKCRIADRNPWGLVPSYWSSDRPDAGRPGGSARYRYFFRHRSANGGEIRVGPNGDIAGSALFLIRAHRLLGDARYLATAQRQVDWILGCNPFDASTVEGVGLNQPARYLNGGEFFPPTPQIPGAVMTGIMGDEHDDPEPFGNNCSTEYDIPSSAPLMWLLSELSE